MGGIGLRAELPERLVVELAAEKPARGILVRGIPFRAVGAGEHVEAAEQLFIPAQLGEFRRPGPG
jgi:hypothetical protein